VGIYIACGLTHVPRRDFANYVSFIHGLAAHITSNTGAEVRYALRDSDPQLAQNSFSERVRLCYLWDREMVEWADVVAAEASYPSTGLGIELQVAESKNTPIVICFNDSLDHQASPVEYQNPDESRHHLQIGEAYISLMALGLPSVFKVVRYSSHHSGYLGVCNALKLLKQDDRRKKT
jgi:hypothetical protein